MGVSTCYEKKKKKCTLKIYAIKIHHRCSRNIWSDSFYLFYTSRSPLKPEIKRVKRYDNYGIYGKNVLRLSNNNNNRIFNHYINLMLFNFFFF